VCEDFFWGGDHSISQSKMGGSFIYSKAFRGDHLSYILSLMNIKVYYLEKKNKTTKAINKRIRKDSGCSYTIWLFIKYYVNLKCQKRFICCDIKGCHPVHTRTG